MTTADEIIRITLQGQIAHQADKIYLDSPLCAKMKAGMRPIKRTRWGKIKARARYYIGSKFLSLANMRYYGANATAKAGG